MKTPIIQCHFHPTLVFTSLTHCCTAHIHDTDYLLIAVIALMIFSSYKKPSNSKPRDKIVLRKTVGKISFGCVRELHEQQSMHAVCTVPQWTSLSFCKYFRITWGEFQATKGGQTQAALNLGNSGGNEISFWNMAHSITCPQGRNSSSCGFQVSGDTCPDLQPGLLKPGSLSLLIFPFLTSPFHSPFHPFFLLSSLH